jgi:hypothetical protein
VVETSIDNAFGPGGADGYNLLGTARGTYLPGYGTLFTAELQLVYVAPMMPFHPTITPEEKQSTHERKVKKLAVLREAMQNQLASAGRTLDGMPLNERIALEVILFNFSWEDLKGIPQRVLMTAEKGKLLDAQTNHTDLSGVIQEQDQ